MIDCHISFIDNSIEKLCDYDNSSTIISTEIDKMECLFTKLVAMLKDILLLLMNK